MAKNCSLANKRFNKGLAITCRAHEVQQTLFPKGSNKCNQHVNVTRNNLVTVETEAVYDASGMSLVTECSDGLWVVA